MTNGRYVDIENDVLRIRLTDIKKAAKILLKELKEKGYDPTEAVEELKKKLK